MNENAQLAEFATNLWNNFIKQKVGQAMSDSLSFYRATVVSNDGNNLLTIQRPFDNAYQVRCADQMKSASEGQEVIVLRFGNGVNNSNHLVIADGDGGFGILPEENGGTGSSSPASGQLPVGGTAGQVLTKNSSTNYDASWKNLNVAYVHEQLGTASNTWVVTHNLGFYPNVSVVDTAGSNVIGEVTYDSLNQLTIVFKAAFKGKAYLS